MKGIKTMNTMTKLISVAILTAMAALAQTSMTTTTLSALVSASARDVNVASATGISAGSTALRVDNELMFVLAVNSTRITVLRGAFGTKSSYHGNGATVYIAPPGSYTSYGSIYDPQFSSTLFYPSIAPATVTTATAVTLTTGQVRGGLILQDPSGGAVTTTLPTAALLVAASPGAMLNSSFEFTIRNTADAAETITVAAGTGGTTSGTMTIAQSNTKRFLVRFTNVNAGAETYTVYSLGTVVH